MASTQDETIVELQRANAELQQANVALQQSLEGAQAQQASDYNERAAHQSATIDVLKVMSASPGDPQPVFDLICHRAQARCESMLAGLYEYDGTSIKWGAMTSSVASADAIEANKHRFPWRLDQYPDNALSVCINERRIVHIRDAAVEGGISDFARGQLGARSLVFIPLIKNTSAAGCILLADARVGGYSGSQVELLKTFAEQAVIAISSAETCRALQTRTADLQQSLTYQTATSDVLKVISRSTFDLQPVLDMLAETAARLCDAEQAALVRREGALWQFAANFGFPAEYEAALRARGPMTLDQHSPTVGWRSIREARTVHVADAAAVPGYGEVALRLGKMRTSLGVPLMRECEVIGSFVLSRQRVQPFTEKEVEVVSTFAAQAVIAIANTRLLTEQREALERQTATAEVLRAINASPGNLTPVFQLMVDRALQLCGASFGEIGKAEGDVYTTLAVSGMPEEYAKRRVNVSEHHGPGTSLWSMRHGEDVLHYPNLIGTEAYRNDVPARRSLVDVGGARAGLTIALRKDGAVLGVIAIFRREPGPFSDKQIALLGSFAAQAVIAMENARLINEQREALEQQTATTEVLQVINKSPGDLAPVFDAMLEKGMRLCDAAFGVLRRFDGERIQSLATRGVPTAYAEYNERNDGVPMRGTGPSLALETGRPAHTLDVREGAGYKSGHPAALAVADLGGARTMLHVPLVKDETSVGLFSFYRQEVRAFSGKQIVLLENFAAQAVIAMENARLLGELRERTQALAVRNTEFGERIEQQAATIDVLKVMSSTPDDTQPVFNQIVRRAKELCNGDSAILFQFRDGLVHFSTMCSDRDLNTPAMASYLAQYPMAPTRGSIICRTILDSQIIHIKDIETETDLSPAVRTLIKDGNYRSQVAVPLMRDGHAIGCITLTAAWPGGFTDSQVSLLQTFAEQAVIAVSSVTTFKELRERTGALARSVAELHALEEVLRAVNSSLDLDTVLETIISRAVRLSRADEGTIYEFDEGEEIFVPKSAFGMSEARVAGLRNRRIRIGETPLGMSAASRAPLHIPDLTLAPEEAGAPELVNAGIHALLAVPLLREDKVVGGLVIRRRAAGGFLPTTVTLLQTFAGQCVLAIENARLFQELATRGEEARRARLTAEATLTDLRRTQDRLVQTEKLASLGQLTAGIAHEIKNPLNFVNNFAELSVDLLAELKATAAPGFALLTEDQRADIEDVSAMLTGNLQKINEHGKRADGIVRSMLEHSRGASGERRMVEINTLVEDALNLAYHGARAQDQDFNITLERDYGAGITPIKVNPQDITRMVLNLISNGFYAANKRAQNGADAGFAPTLKVATGQAGDAVEIRVRDNGTGIPVDIRDKLFQPFFTTKPTGEGTGLGLSITYDIVTNAHGGTIQVDSEIGAFTEFVVTLPRRMFANEVSTQ